MFYGEPYKILRTIFHRTPPVTNSVKQNNYQIEPAFFLCGYIFQGPLKLL